jgi:hypothetical protein
MPQTAATPVTTLVCYYPKSFLVELFEWRDAGAARSRAP